MIEIRQTRVYSDWIGKLRDRAAVLRIAIRLRRVSLGNLGDVKSVGHGISELRVDYGPGYRIYLKSPGPAVVILLCGGDKTTQGRDIDRARTLAEEDDNAP